MIHFIGIGGIGMSALARLLLARGVAVSGSDLRKTPLVERLQSEGARIAIGHRAENVEGAERVVVSSAVDAENPELSRARALNIPIVGRGELLAELTKGKRTIAVAGTHGKTTTTAMIACVLEAAGIDPTVAIGGERLDSLSNARAGNGPWFVTESDESDGSFLRLEPTIAVVTNVENDHVANDEEWERLREDFERFVGKIPIAGLLIAGVDDERTAALAKLDAGVPVLSYALAAPQADLRARVERFEDFGTVSEISLHGKTLGTLRMRVPGEINVQNALAALAVAHYLGIDFDVAAEALAGFAGVRRRFEFLARTPRFTVVDDYAHHPTAVRATIATARRYHRGPLVVAFEPHRYTRTKYLAADFASALAGADEVILAPVYAASEPPLAGISSRSIGERLERVAYVDAVDELPAYLREHAPDGALVLMLGAGTISAVAHRLAESFPEHAIR
ncbi:MAG: UDP-N-acetylmuramate--L-alanine ligase [Candidatus Eremiobacteraeota bacterium]|nr:UDP-N-acetylmuramate--L-alanine ligase [Candidatus Eremiobacteraeota bacterium]